MKFTMGLNALFFLCLLLVAIDAKIKSVPSVLIIGGLLLLNVYHLFTRPPK